MEGLLYGPLTLYGLALIPLVFATIIDLRRARRIAGPGAERAALALAKAAAGMGAKGGGDLLTDGAFELTIDGRRLRAFGARPNKGRNVFVGIGLEAGGPAGAGVSFEAVGRRTLDYLPHVVLRAEVGFDRLGKRIGLNFEVQTGDGEFDQRVYVESDSPRDDVATLLSDARLRRGVLALLDAGCTHITFAEGDHLVAALWPSYVPAAISPASLGSTGRELFAIVDALPTLRSREAGSLSTKVPWLEIGYVLGGIGALVCGGMTLFFFPPVGQRMTPLAAGVTLLTTVLLLAISASRVRGRSNALARVCVGAMGVVMLGPGLAIGLLCALNGGLDLTNAEHTVDVEEVFVRRQRSNHTYHARVKSWVPGEHPLVLPLPGPKSFDAIKTSRRALVRTGNGRLGYEWVRSVESL